jgi:hypothetical protein
MPELMGAASLFNNMDPAQLAQLQKMAAQVRDRTGRGQAPAIMMEGRVQRQWC